MMNVGGNPIQNMQAMLQKMITMLDSPQMQGIGGDQAGIGGAAAPTNNQALGDITNFSQDALNPQAGGQMFNPFAGGDTGNTQAVGANNGMGTVPGMNPPMAGQGNNTQLTQMLNTLKKLLQGMGVQSQGGGQNPQIQGAGSAPGMSSPSGIGSANPSSSSSGSPSSSSAGSPSSSSSGSPSSSSSKDSSSSSSGSPSSSSSKNPSSSSSSGSPSKSSGSKGGSKSSLKKKIDKNSKKEKEKEKIRKDPVVLDLNGDGKAGVTDDTSANFDFDTQDGTGKKEKTQWLKKNSGDGMLVWDVDGDNKITSSKELFGNFDIDGKEKFSDGYQKMAKYFDKNKDGKVEGGELNGLKVWKDDNGDGETQQGELKSLKEMGISSFDVSKAGQGAGVEGNFTKDGQQQKMWDVNFKYDK